MDKVGPTGVRVGRRLNELRRERGYTLADLEVKLSELGRPILLSALSKIEKNVRRVDVDDLVALARALDVSPNSLWLPGPTETDANVELTPTTTVSLDDAWRWALRDQPPTRARRGILIAHTQADKAWGAWIARQLVEVGHDVTVDSWDVDRAACVIAVVSESYQRSDRGQELLGLALDRPDLPVLFVSVDGSAPTGPLSDRQLIRIDESSEQRASDVILEAVDQLAIPRPQSFDDARFPHPYRRTFTLSDYAPSNVLMPLYRAIVAIDIEGSTVRSNPAKARSRLYMYQMFEIALRRTGVIADSSDLLDRGDGFVVLIPPNDAVPMYLLLATLMPTLSELLAEHNAREPANQMRLKAAVHAGEVHFDQRGPFGESLDITMRLLDSAEVNAALRTTTAPLALVVSEDIYRSVIRHSYSGIDDRTFEPLVNIDLAGQRYRGWVQTLSGSVNR